MAGTRDRRVSLLCDKYVSYIHTYIHTYILFLIMQDSKRQHLLMWACEKSQYVEKTQYVMN